jgi:hypothetical protein
LEILKPNRFQPTLSLGRGESVRNPENESSTSIGKDCEITTRFFQPALIKKIIPQRITGIEKVDSIDASCSFARQITVNHCCRQPLPP